LRGEEKEKERRRRRRRRENLGHLESLLAKKISRETSPQLASRRQTTGKPMKIASEGAFKPVF